jgi:acyl-CoA synthetase (AMP-forming)/AMP-acid ligase II
LSACGEGGGEIEEQTQEAEEQAEEAGGECGDLNMAVNPWVGYEASAYVVGTVAEQELGCTVNYKDLKEDVSWQGFGTGEVDVVIEDWGHPDLEKKFFEGEGDGTAMDFGPQGNVGIIGWYVPPWLAEEHPDVLDWKNLNKYAQEFATSESGGQGQSITSAGATVHEVPRFSVNAETTVLDDELRPAGVGVVGKLARRGRIPLGYYKDEQKTAATFPVVDGVRWSVPGDHARIEEDGTITLLGRGSVSINTGGEKVYPEEVEAALKGHPAVFDAVVVGVPDSRWGERVVAVVQPRGDATPQLDELDAHVREHVAGYKAPRDVVLVDEILRSPSGKPDYRWAKATATDRLGTGATR